MNEPRWLKPVCFVLVLLLFPISAFVSFVVIPLLNWHGELIWKWQCLFGARS